MNWKNEIRKQLKDNFGDAVKIRFKGNDPTLVFQDNVYDQTKQMAMKFVELLVKEMGGKVKFYPERAKHTSR